MVLLPDNDPVNLTAIEAMKRSNNNIDAIHSLLRLLFSSMLLLQLVVVVVVVVFSH